MLDLITAALVALSVSLLFWVQFISFMLISILALKMDREAMFVLCGIGCFVAAAAATKAYTGELVPHPLMLAMTAINTTVHALCILNLEGLEQAMLTASRRRKAAQQAGLPA